VVIADAPIFLLPDSTREPLRVAKQGSALRLIEQAGDWDRIEFQDPEYGRRVGYIQTKFAQRAIDRALEPVDVSVPEAPATGEASPTRPAQEPLRGAGTPVRTTPPHGGMPTKYKVWGGILLGLSAYYFASYAVTEPNRITCIFDTCYSNNTLRSIWLTMGFGLAGGGTAVLAVGAHAGQETAPSITVTPGSISITRTIGLSRRSLRFPRRPSVQ
jgi:hypothetical protein